MAEDEDQAIGTALALLAVEDAEAANEAQAALEWITQARGSNWPLSTGSRVSAGTSSRSSG